MGRPRKPTDDAAATPAEAEARRVIAANIADLVETRRARGLPSSYVALEDATAATGIRVGKSTIQRIAAGTTNPELRQLVALADALGVTLADLVTEGGAVAVRARADALRAARAALAALEGATPAPVEAHAKRKRAA